MKQKIFLLLALAAPTFGFSQNEYLNYKYSLSVNALFSHNYVQTSGVYEKGSSISGITSSFFIMDEAKNQHEISLEKLTLGSPDYYFDSYELRSNNAVDVSVGYKYHFNFMKRKTSRWIPSVGGWHARFFPKDEFCSNRRSPFRDNAQRRRAAILRSAGNYVPHQPAGFSHPFHSCQRGNRRIEVGLL